MPDSQVKRLVIVGDGALQYLPFGALPSPLAEGTGARDLGSVASGIASRPPTVGSRPPLIADYEIVSLPSASTLAVLRRENANRPPPTKSVAVLADPVFEKTDERVQVAMAHSRQVPNGQSAAPAREASFDRLIKSRALLRAFDFRANSE